MPHALTISTLSLCCAALAASSSPTRVDQSIADVGPLSVGRVDLRADLQLPTDFTHVYLITDPTDPTRTVFARANHGITAVFPRSTYTLTNQGPFPTIPPNTTFYIGPPPPPPSTTTTSTIPQPNAISTLANTRVATQPQDTTKSHPTHNSPATPRTTIFNNDTYRVARLRTLLNTAASNATRR